jgi:hypothetical protein
MAVYVSNIVIEQGFTFTNTFEFESINTNQELNLVGYGITAQLKKNYSSSSAVSFACTVVVGSTGYIGKYVVKESIRRGYETIAVVRPGSKPKDQYFDGAKVVYADVTDISSIENAIGDDKKKLANYDLMEEREDEFEYKLIQKLLFITSMYYMGKATTKDELETASKIFDGQDILSTVAK